MPPIFPLGDGWNTTHKVMVILMVDGATGIGFLQTRTRLGGEIKVRGLTSLPAG